MKVGVCEIVLLNDMFGVCESIFSG
jgi:hypothetical protein